MRRIDEPERYASARPFSVHMHDSHQRELSHQDNSLDQESFSTTICFTIHLFCCGCHHESTMSQDEGVLCIHGNWSAGLWAVGFITSRQESRGRLPICEIEFEDARTAVRLHNSNHTWGVSDSRKIEVLKEKSE